MNATCRPAVITLTRLLSADVAADAADIVAVLALTADDRTRSRHRFTAEDGTPVMLRLPRGTLLRGNTLLASEAGELVRVVAKPEPVVVVTAASDFALLRATYHLGNRHVPLEISPDHLKLQPDPVLEAMLEQLGGLSLTTEERPFEPEAGAYHTGHHSRDGHSHNSHSHNSHDSHSHNHPSHDRHRHGHNPVDRLG